MTWMEQMNRKEKFVIAFEAMYATFKHPFGQKNPDVYRAITDNFYSLTARIEQDDFTAFMTESFKASFPSPDQYQRAVSTWVSKKKGYTFEKITEENRKWGFLNSQIVKCWQLLAYPRGLKVLAMYHIGGCRRLGLEPQKFFTDHIQTYTEDTNYEWDRVEKLIKQEMRKHVNPTVGDWYKLGQINAGR